MTHQTDSNGRAFGTPTPNIRRTTPGTDGTFASYHNSQGEQVPPSPYITPHHNQVDASRPPSGRRPYLHYHLQVDEAWKKSEKLVERNTLDKERLLLEADCEDYSSLVQEFPAMRQTRERVSNLDAKVQMMDLNIFCPGAKNSSQGRLPSQSQGTTGNRLLGSTSGTTDVITSSTTVDPGRAVPTVSSSTNDTFGTPSAEDQKPAAKQRPLTVHSPFLSNEAPVPPCAGDQQPLVANYSPKFGFGNTASPSAEDQKQPAADQNQFSSGWSFDGNKAPPSAGGQKQAPAQQPKFGFGNTASPSAEDQKQPAA
eukprot:CAMPEP_0113658272 /NCGR_PEP_ID=MMETSP0017_2-20120614/31623_1 /TAXON_ID=2856 /ORGANISM="Cylindrotheca closterium" /LENGTH=310 /DNA_ID=CAMNT_0000572519 /DNA_START=131 /DNA_END=1060 /DNA_ORIENTATION=- /assembly_acc=CAM_ASM_000147